MTVAIQSLLHDIETYISPLIKNGTCIAFSGGVDSSLLLKIACHLGNIVNIPVTAVTFDTKLHPSADLFIAKAVAKESGAIHHILEVNELENIDILNNPVDRCYRCKKYLFETLRQFAEENNLNYVIDGTNFDDLSAYRPGIQALKELNIISPLVDLKITKSQVRALAEFMGISVSTRPSAPCLATRLPYNTKIDFDLLSSIEKGEDFLKNQGFPTNRLRVHNDILRIEILPDEFPLFFKKQDIVLSYLKSLNFSYVTLDLEGFRSGSMDIHINSNK